MIHRLLRHRTLRTFCQGKMSPEKMKELSQRYARGKEQEMKKGSNAGLVLCGVAAGVHVLWQVLPFNQMFSHFSLNEYIFQRHYYHAIFLQSLSFPTRGNMLVYFPLMLSAAFLSRKQFSCRTVLLMFGLNAVNSTVVTYAYEKVYLQKNMVTPKYGGASSALAYSSMLAAHRPHTMLLGSRFLPFALLPLVLLMHEYDEFMTTHVNEVSRPAHFASAFLGLSLGLLLRLRK